MSAENPRQQVRPPREPGRLGWALTGPAGGGVAWPGVSVRHMRWEGEVAIGVAAMDMGLDRGPLRDDQPTPMYPPPPRAPPGETLVELLPNRCLVVKWECQRRVSAIPHVGDRLLTQALTHHQKVLRLR